MNQSFARQQRWLRLSILGFGLLTALLSLGLFTVYLNQAVPSPLGFHLQLPASLAVALTSIFCWWWLIVTPKRLTIFQGSVAGIASILYALPLMWLLIFSFDALSGRDPIAANLLETLQSAGVLWFFSNLYLVSSPPGWLILALGVMAGSSYALLIRRLVGPLLLEQPEGAGSQEEPAPTRRFIVI